MSLQAAAATHAPARAGALALACLLLPLHAPAAPEPPPPAPGPLVGRWLLVHQTYGRGKANLVEGSAAVELEVLPGPAGLTARLRRSDRPGGGAPWPAWAAGEEGEPRAPEKILERRIDPAAGVLHARYRLHPSPGDDMVLEVEESYRLAAGGETLEGSLTATFLLGEEKRGSFTLTRRFERAP